MFTIMFVRETGKVNPKSFSVLYITMVPMPVAPPVTSPLGILKTFVPADMAVTPAAIYTKLFALSFNPITSIKKLRRVIITKAEFFYLSYISAFLFLL